MLEPPGPHANSDASFAVGRMDRIALLAWHRLGGVRSRRRALVLAAMGVALTTAIATPALASSYGDMAWGENQWGQLGNETTIASDVPVAVSGLSGVISVSGGGSNNMALLSNGTVMGWGSNASGELCNGSRTKTDVPMAMSNVSEAAAISAGGFDSLILMTNGSVMACGENYYGQLGDGTMGGSSALPVEVSGLSGVTAISADGYASLALLSNGTVMAWGENDCGQLGDGTSTTSDVPVAVSGPGGVIAISAGREYGLALLSNGTVIAWGDNAYGQLGDGTSTDSDTPVPVSGLSEVTAVSSGGDTSLALLRNGTVMAWGDNAYGQLGDGSTTQSDVPVPVGGLHGVTAISAGSWFNLALLSNGSVMGWGRNSVGQLGDGTTTDSDVPVAVSGLGEVAGIAATNGNDSFAYGPPAPTIPSPTLTDMDPKYGPASGGTTVTITGTNLTGATAVEFGSVSAASFNVTSATSITAVTPPQAARPVNVSVTTPYATTVISSVDRFTFRPTVTKLEPDTGSRAGGTKVTVTGAGFALGKTATSFEFGSTTPTSVNCTSTTTCIVVAPAHAAGKVAVVATVNAINSAKTPADKFKYN